MATTNGGGWTGKTLRVNLTNRTALAEATQLDWMGGTGVGYKVIFDEVPPGTPWYSTANKIVVGTGPLTGSGAPCGGRTCYTAIWPAGFPYDNLVATGHHGGYFGPELKFAGWDNIIIEGQASAPVWLRIEDSLVTFENAAPFWKEGIFKTTKLINEAMGQEAMVAAIGTAGSNLVRQAGIISGRSHSAGGVGAVFGSKNLKAIGVIGTGGVKIANSAAWKTEVEFALSIIGSNNQHVMPRTWQGWNEYIASGSRWYAKEGLYWGAAVPPVNTGDNRPDQLDRIGYRCQKAWGDLGAVAEAYTVRMNGCHACPIRCHGSVSVPSVKQYTDAIDLPSTSQNTCLGWSGPKAYGRNQTKITYPGQEPTAGSLNGLHMQVIATNTADNYGLWCNYGLQQRVFNWAYDSGYLKTYIQGKSATEWATVAPLFDQMVAGSPTFPYEIQKIMANRTGYLGEWLQSGPGAMAWALSAKQTDGTYDKYKEYLHHHTLKQWGSRGHPYHHGPEGTFQVGALVNMMYNRDPQQHSHSNFGACGVPLSKLKEIMEQQFGTGFGDAIDDIAVGYTRMNDKKAKFALWSLERKELYDSLSLCAWMYPFIPSPLKSRNYGGDVALEARLYSACTGNATTADQLSMMGRKIFVLHRALTAREMKAAYDATNNCVKWATNVRFAADGKTILFDQINVPVFDRDGVPVAAGTYDVRNLRVNHDAMPPWTSDYTGVGNDKPFVAGSQYMEEADMNLARDLIYDLLLWNKANGLPTQACYDQWGLSSIAAKMTEEGLLG